MINTRAIFDAVLEAHLAKPTKRRDVYVSQDAADALTAQQGGCVFSLESPFLFGAQVIGADWYVDPRLSGTDFRIEDRAEKVVA